MQILPTCYTECDAQSCIQQVTCTLADQRRTARPVPHCFRACLNQRHRAKNARISGYIASYLVVDGSSVAGTMPMKARTLLKSREDARESNDTPLVLRENRLDQSCRLVSGNERAGCSLPVLKQLPYQYGRHATAVRYLDSNKLQDCKICFRL